MDQAIPLTCPTYGGKRQITGDTERFACTYCGNEHNVRRSGGIVSIAPLVNEIAKVRTGVDKTVSELVIRHSKDEIDDCQKSYLTYHFKKSVTFSRSVMSLGLILFGILFLFMSLTFYTLSVILISLGFLGVGGYLSYNSLQIRTACDVEMQSILPVANGKKKEIENHKRLISSSD